MGKTKAPSALTVNDEPDRSTLTTDEVRDAWIYAQQVVGNDDDPAPFDEWLSHTKEKK